MKNQNFPFSKTSKNLRNSLKILSFYLALAILSQHNAMAMFKPWVERDFDPSVRFAFKDIEHVDDGEMLSTPAQAPTRSHTQICGLYEGAPEGVREIRINPVDGRTRVLEPTKWPFSIHCQIHIEAPGLPAGGGGSGTLVGPHHVLTAAHNIFEPETLGGWAHSLTIHPALNDNAAPFGAFKGAKVYLYEEWVKSRGTKQEVDIALIILTRSVGLRTGWAGMLSLDSATLKKQKFHVTGYPGDKGCNQMWTMEKCLDRVEDELFCYKIDTMAGQSGGAVWIKQWGIPHLAGVHTTGATGGNMGVRLSEQKLRDVIQWMSETGEIKKGSSRMEPYDDEDTVHSYASASRQVPTGSSRRPSTPSAVRRVGAAAAASSDVELSDDEDRPSSYVSRPRQAPTASPRRPSTPSAVRRTAAAAAASSDVEPSDDEDTTSSYAPRSRQAPISALRSPSAMRRAGAAAAASSGVEPSDDEDRPSSYAPRSKQAPISSPRGPSTPSAVRRTAAAAAASSDVEPSDDEDTTSSYASRPRQAPTSSLRRPSPGRATVVLRLTDVEPSVNKDTTSSYAPRPRQEPISSSRRPPTMPREDATLSAMLHSFLAANAAAAGSAVPRPFGDGLQIPAIARGYEGAYRRFMGGKLIYKPDLYSDKGRIEFPIAALADPLNGVFDLSRCGETGKYLSIATGYRTGKKAENAEKLEIWFAPYFLIRRNLEGDAAHFKPIMAGWDADSAPVGIFWTWGGTHHLEWYDYWTSGAPAFLGSRNLLRASIRFDSAMCGEWRHAWYRLVGQRYLGQIEAASYASIDYALLL